MESVIRIGKEKEKYSYPHCPDQVTKSSRKFHILFSCLGFDQGDYGQFFSKPFLLHLHEIYYILIWEIPFYVSLFKIFSVMKGCIRVDKLIIQKDIGAW